MPTTNWRGLPLYNGAPGGDVMPAWDVAFNGQSNALATALDDSEAALHAADSVATIAELPVVGNWDGRLIWVAEDDRVRRWDGAQWGVIGFPPSITTTPTLGSGWATPSLNSIYQRSGWVQLNFNAYRTSSGSFGTVVVDVPVGYRGDFNVFQPAIHLVSTGVLATPNTIMCWYDRDTEQVKLYQNVAADRSIAFTMTWPLEGAT